MVRGEGERQAERYEEKSEAEVFGRQSPVPASAPTKKGLKVE